MEGIRALISPKNIAVIGASRENGKVGNIVFDNLLSGRCTDRNGAGLRSRGKVFAVNPNAEEVLGERCYSTVLDIKEPIDLAVVCVPIPVVPKVLESCGKKKVKAAIIITAGYSEAGTKGKEAEKGISEIAEKHNIRILGPNCLGVINNFSGMNASFATAKMPEKYKVGIFSQSGAMGAAILDFANGNDFGFSYFVSLGNKTDISEVDLLDSWASDSNVQVGVGYIEDIKDGPAFVSAAQKFTRKKPLIILKGGMTKEGEKAATLHTAAMAGDEVVFKAAMREVGVVLARDMNDLFELAVSFAEDKKLKQGGLAVISNAGGPSVLTADACGREVVKLAELSSHTIHHIAKNTEAASVANPIDLRGDATSNDFKAAIRACMKDANVGGILVVATPQAMTDVESIAWEIIWAKKESKIPIYVNFIGGECVAKAKEICAEAGVPLFAFPERAVRAFKFQSEFVAKKTTSQSKLSQSRHPKHHVTKSLLRFSGTEPSYNQIASILRLYDVPMAESVLVKSEKELPEALKKIKPPVIMKISSPEILHKTDVGGVVFGIDNLDEAEKAFAKIISNVKKHKPRAHIRGVVVNEMASEGVEIILGAKRDPIFGPVLMIGFGGIFTELVSDFSVVLAPFTRGKILAALSDTTIAKIIKGYRGGKYNGTALVRAAMGMGQLVIDHPEIEQVEVNPLRLEEDGSGIIGLDAKIKIVDNEK